jgi:hypothetical protein
MSMLNLIPDAIRRMFSSASIEDFPKARDFWRKLVPAPFARLLDSIGFSWSREKQAWLDAFGKVVDSHRLASDFVEAVKKEMRSLASEAKVSLRRWFAMSAAKIKSERIALGALASGGFRAMTASVLRKISGKPDEPGPGLAFAINRLGDLAEESPELSEKQIGARAELAAAAGWGSYESTRRDSAITAGKTMERNVLDDGAIHCHPTLTTVGCPELTGMGWQPIGSMPLPSTAARTCFVNCRCSMEFK